ARLEDVVEVASQRGPVGPPQQVAPGAATGPHRCLHLAGDVAERNWPAVDLRADVLLEDLVDEGPTVGGRDRLLLAGVVELAHLEHVTDEVAERADRPVLERRGRTQPAERIAELGPRADPARPLAELPAAAGAGGRQ